MRLYQARKVGAMYLCVRSIDYTSVSICDYIFRIFTTVVICVFHFIIDITLPTFICLIQEVSQLFTIFLTNVEDYFFHDIIQCM